MNATAPNYRGPMLDETVAHEPPTASAAGPDRPQEPHPMPAPSPMGADRFTYGSGARPLDGYTIKRAIGRGGFGEVYYATSDAGKDVALKLIVRNAEIERRGVVQCMNLKSPHLVTVYDIKTNDAGDVFVIMEYVAGPSLANILARHPAGLPLPEVRTWMKGLVEGVAYLHDHGIVHRDLKPANLFLEEGVVKIGDYGLSKAISASGPPGHSESIGTCYYMAPEISTGKYHRPIDIYATGVIFYEMLTGRVPFDGETVGEVLMKHLTARPDLSSLPEPYRGLVGKALAKDPNHRQGHAFELLTPADAPSVPPVRFIGEGKTSPPVAPAPAPSEAKDEVLRIEAEEPVFYIGPNTVPPRRIQTVRRRLWGPGPARIVPPPPAPIPIPPPPPLPGGRIRLAELATSMLLAAPLAGLLSVPAALVMGLLGPPGDPRPLAYLFGLTLLGTWGVLILSKSWEGRKVSCRTRRLVFLAIGLALGAGGMALQGTTRLELTPAWEVDGLVDLSGPPSHPGLLGHAAFFGSAFWLIGWGKLAARDRRRRFRLLPLLSAGLVGGLMGVLWSFPQPWGLGVLALVALVVQSVSPWDEAAAEHVRLTKRGRSWT